VIRVAAETLAALSQKEMAFKVRVIWNVEAGGTPLDVSDRVLEISPIERSLAPFLSGFQISDCNITLRNEDGKFARGVNTSYLRTGPTRYHLTKLTVEQGIRRADMTWEYVPVFTGRVYWVRFTSGQIEVKVVSQFTLLRNHTIAEEYQFGQMHIAGIPQALKQHFSLIVTKFSSLTAADIDTAGLDYLFMTGMEMPSGWLLTGTIPQGASVGTGLEDFARSILCTAIETETGKLTFVPEVWPRTWCELVQSSSAFPVRFDETNAQGFEVVDGLATTATEVIVHYQGTSMRYPAAALATDANVGRISRNISCPYMTHGHTAGWAARLIYEHFKSFPLACSFSTFGWGLLVQLNDRVNFTDPETGLSFKGRVVTKVWSKAVVSIGLIVGPTEIFDGSFALVGTTNWDSGTVL
jgi:hypothetical protein